MKPLREAVATGALHFRGNACGTAGSGVLLEFCAGEAS